MANGEPANQPMRVHIRADVQGMRWLCLVLFVLGGFYFLVKTVTCTWQQQQLIFILSFCKISKSLQPSQIPGSSSNSVDFTSSLLSAGNQRLR